MERASIFSNGFGYAEGIVLAKAMRYTIFCFEEQEVLVHGRQ
jgi:hypothetical protein